MLICFSLKLASHWRSTEQKIQLLILFKCTAYNEGLFTLIGLTSWIGIVVAQTVMTESLTTEKKKEKKEADKF